jgi:hypothetical protein
MTVDYIGNGNDDGTDFGQSTSDKIGFYGLTTPIAQPTVTAACLTTAATTTTPYGFTTLAQANSLTQCVYDMRTRLVALGLLGDGVGTG